MHTLLGFGDVDPFQDRFWMDIAFHNPKYNHLRALMVKIIAPKRDAEEPVEAVAVKRSRW